MASKSYGWDVRNIAKISPKMVKKGHFSTSEGKRPKPTPLPHMRLWFKISYLMGGFSVFAREMIAVYNFSSADRMFTEPTHHEFCSNSGVVCKCKLVSKHLCEEYSIIFRSRKKFSTTYAIVLFFFVFFLPTFS